MKTGIAIVTTAVCTTAAALSGTVTNSSGEPLKNSIVRYTLGSETLYDTTGSDGAFIFGSGASPISSAAVTAAAELRFSGQKLTVKGTAYRKVSIFTVNGRQISSLNGSQLNSSVTFDLSGFTPAAGVHILELSGEKERVQLKALFSGKQWKIQAPALSSAKTATLQSRSSRAESTGELALYTPGYRTEYRAVADDSWLNVTLTASNQAASGSGELSGSMVRIPAAARDFEMGIWESADNGESPVHTVQFRSDFWMDTALVTQGEYSTLMSAAYGDAFVIPAWSDQYGIGDSHPAYAVLWSDAVLYCNAKSKAEGLDTVYSYSGYTGNLGYFAELEGIEADLSKNGYRLPTEAEWEYAARGGTNSLWFWGNEADTASLNRFTVWAGNSFNATDPDAYGVHPVGDREPNSYGLYDMAGNLYQWCHELHSDYPAEPVTDPVGPSSESAADYMNTPVIRGGSWGNEPEYLRSGSRGFSFANYFSYFLGFRTVRNAE